MVSTRSLEIDDAVWSALNDPSRRQILDLLRAKSMTTNALCMHFEFSRFAVMKHLKILQKGGLIVIGPETYEKLKDYTFDCEPLPAQELKGIAQPIQTYLVKGES